MVMNPVVQSKESIPANYLTLVIQSDLFGMVRWPFEGVKWRPTRGWKGHFESPPARSCLLIRPEMWLFTTGILGEFFSNLPLRV